MHTCEFCKSEFTHKSSFNRHQKTSRFCVKIQEKKGNEVTTDFVNCEYCKKQFTTKQTLNGHIEVCKKRPTNGCVYIDRHDKKFRESQFYLTYNDFQQTNIDMNSFKNSSRSHCIDLFVKHFNRRIDLNYFLPAMTYDDIQNIFNIFDLNSLKQISYEDYTTRVCDTFYDYFNGLQTKKIKNSKLEETNEIVYPSQPLDINNYQLIYRKEDGYIDVTNLCKAGGKLFKNWNGLEKTQAFIDVLSRSAGIPADLLIQSVTGGKNEDRKTWVHPQVAINISQWISPEFDVKVSKWIMELLTVGRVDLGREKTDMELQLLYKQKIEQVKLLTEENQKLTVKINSSLKSHRYFKFNETGQCFYIIDPGTNCDCAPHKKKFGIAGTSKKAEIVDSIDERLRSHRTTWPMLKVEFVLFVKEVNIIEKNFKLMFEKSINPNGHEIIEGINTQEMIKRIMKLLNILDITDYLVLPDESLKKYNDYVDTTRKVTETTKLDKDDHILPSSYDDQNLPVKLINHRSQTRFSHEERCYRMRCNCIGDYTIDELWPNREIYKNTKTKKIPNEFALSDDLMKEYNFFLRASEEELVERYGNE